MFDLSEIQYIRSSHNTTEQLVFCIKTWYSNTLEGINEIFPTILHFLSSLENFSIADAKLALNDFKFCENQHNESYTLLRSVYPYFLHLLSNLGPYKRPALKAAKHTFANCDNWCKKGRTFRVGVNQITFTHIHWHIMMFSKMFWEGRRTTPPILSWCKMSVHMLTCEVAWNKFCNNIPQDQIFSQHSEKWPPQ